MVTAFELGKQAADAHRRLIKRRRVYAVMGRVLNDGSKTLRVTDDGTKLPNNKIYVRVDDSIKATRVVWNTRTDARVGLPCYIEENPDGSWYVEGIEDEKATNFLGLHAPGANVPPKDAEASDGIVIGGRGFRPGALLPTSITSLTFQVMPFYYRYFDSIKYWDNSATIDLTAYLPVTSGAWAFVWVGINPLDNTLTAVTSAEVSLKALLTADVLTATDMSGLVASDAVMLQEGDTAWTPADNDIVYARPFNDQWNPILPTELGTGLIGAGRVLQLYGPITISGTMTIKGTLQIS